MGLSRDILLKNICDLENWLNGPGSAWYLFPVRVAGFVLLFLVLMLSNLVAIAAIPFGWLKPSTSSRLEELPNSPLAANDDNFDVLVDQYSDQASILVDFWAPWCGPCLLMKPAIEEFARHHTGSVVVLTFNTTMSNQIPKKFGIAGLPTLILLREKQEVARNVGALDSNALADWIAENSTGV